MSISTCCFYCGKEFNPLESYFIIRVQKKKFQKRQKIGKCCTSCEARGVKTDYSIWAGDKLPKE